MSGIWPNKWVEEAILPENNNMSEGINIERQSRGNETSQLIRDHTINNATGNHLTWANAKISDHHIPQFKRVFLMFSFIKELYSVFSKIHTIH